MVVVASGSQAAEDDSHDMTPASALNRAPTPASAPARLARCEGFRVRSPHGHLGFVAGVEPDPATGEPLNLAVRVGRVAELVVPVDRVEELSLERRLIVIGAYAPRLVPTVRGGRLVLRPHPAPGGGL